MAYKTDKDWDGRCESKGAAFFSSEQVSKLQPPRIVFSKKKTLQQKVFEKSKPCFSWPQPTCQGYVYQGTKRYVLMRHVRGTIGSNSFWFRAPWDWSTHSHHHIHWSRPPRHLCSSVQDHKLHWRLICLSKQKCKQYEQKTDNGVPTAVCQETIFFKDINKAQLQLAGILGVASPQENPLHDGWGQKMTPPSTCHCRTRWSQDTSALFQYGSMRVKTC